MVHRFAAVAVLFLATAAGGCGERNADDGSTPGDATRGRGSEEAAGSVRPSSGAPDARPDTVLDATGRQVVLEVRPRRIVSLVPAATETLQALGATGRLVARTEYDTATALQQLPSVGGGLNPTLELVLAAEPDLVIRFAAGSDPGTPRALDRAEIPHLAVRPERVEDIQAMISLLGRITGREATADSILRHQRQVLEIIRSRVQNLPPRPFTFTLGGAPPFVAGPETYVSELLVLAGGRNVFDDVELPWTSVEPETFRSRSPEVVLAPEGAELDPRLAPEARVRRVSPRVQIPGPELDQAARALARALRPDLFR